MEVDSAIILALREPLSYSKLYTESRNIRKENGQTLSREAFDNGVKRLVGDKIINRKEINRRDVQYSLSQSSSEKSKYLVSSIEDLEKDILWLEPFISRIERMASEIDQQRMKLSEIDYQNFLNNNDSYRSTILDYQSIIASIVSYLFTLQKSSSFFTSKKWNVSFTKKNQIQQQKKYSDLIDRFLVASMKLDKTSSKSVIAIISMEISKEVNEKTQVCERIISKLIAKA